MAATLCSLIFLTLILQLALILLDATVSCGFLINLETLETDCATSNIITPQRITITKFMVATLCNLIFLAFTMQLAQILLDTTVLCGSLINLKTLETDCT